MGIAIRLCEDPSAENEARPCHRRTAFQGPRGLCSETGESWWHYTALDRISNILCTDRTACGDYFGRPGCCKRHVGQAGTLKYVGCVASCSWQNQCIEFPLKSLHGV